MEKRTSKASITAAERLQLLGLLTLAQRHNRMLDEVRKAVVELVGEIDREGLPDENGHAADAVFSSDAPDVDELLHRLRLPVVADSSATPVADA